jgi:uncharacterized protein HemX
MLRSRGKLAEPYPGSATAAFEAAFGFPAAAPLAEPYPGSATAAFEAAFGFSCCCCKVKTKGGEYKGLALLLLQGLALVLLLLLQSRENQIQRVGSATAGKREQSYCSRASLLEANKTLNKAQVTRLNRENDRLEIKGRLKIKLGYNI